MFLLGFDYWLGWWFYDLVGLRLVWLSTPTYFVFWGLAVSLVVSVYDSFLSGGLGFCLGVCYCFQFTSGFGLVCCHCWNLQLT